jgi:hypothetical protein
MTIEQFVPGPDIGWYNWHFGLNVAASLVAIAGVASSVSHAAVGD